MNEEIMSRHNKDSVLFSVRFHRYENIELIELLALKSTKFNLFYNIMLIFFLAHEIEHYHYQELPFAYYSTCILISITKA